MSPNRSRSSRATGKKKTAPPNNQEEQQSWRRNYTQRATKRASNSSGLHLPKSTLKIAFSGGREQNNLQIPTLKSPQRNHLRFQTASNLKGGFSFISSRSLSGNRKYFDSPNASPKPFQSLGRKEEFGSQRKAPRILFKIYQEIASHRQGNSSITSYFTKLKELWDQLAKTYSDLPQYSSDAIEMMSEHMEREKVIQFLVGLNDSYSSICSKILLMRPFPTVDTAFSVIILKENRRKLVILSQEVVEEKEIMQND